VELEAGATRCFYFIGPKNGGLEIEHQHKEITVITPQSPLGQELMGKIAGQRWTGKLGGAAAKCHIDSVS
jgi:transcription elongation GreA/GreB family factor